MYLNRYFFEKVSVSGYFFEKTRLVLSVSRYKILYLVLVSNYFFGEYIKKNLYLDTFLQVS